MAEIFKNFNAVLNVTGETMEIVPSALTGYNTSNVKYNTENYGINIRTINSTVQVHSLYITNVWNPRIINENRYKEDFFKHADLLIKDKNNDLTLYIAHDIELVPGCPFYIEKNITLTPSQTLNIYAPTSGESTQGNSDINIHISASAIEFLSDE